MLLEGIPAGTESYGSDRQYSNEQDASPSAGEDEA